MRKGLDVFTMLEYEVIRYSSYTPLCVAYITTMIAILLL
jgi:hypothetical protein